MSRPTLRRLVSATALSAMALSVLPASSALAEPRDIQTFACPEGDVPDPGFSDDAGFAEDAIHCIVWYGLAQGTTDTTYSPSALVGRGAMAKFLANLVTAGGVELPAEPEDAFEDDENSPFEHFINQLAEVGVVDGTSETTYDPGGQVRREQMATFLNNAYEAITGERLTSDENAFDDDDGRFHEPNINAVAAAGIAAGTSATKFSPTDPVRRDQMAVFLARELDLLVEEGFVEVPRTAGDNETAIDVPELLRVEQASATTVRFVFDEALNSATSTAAFGLYRYDATRTEASSTAREGTNAVLATFDAEAVDTATLAGVAAGAVQDTTSKPSSEGHAALADVTLPAGSTAAPDLLSVTVAENRATFTFDEAAFSLDDTGYHLVLDDGTRKDSSAVASGDGTETHTVTFELTAAEAALVAYGYVDDGTVSDTEDDGNPLNGAEGDLNVLQAADVSEDGLTDRPDLIEVIVVNSTQVRYVFDENVTRTTGDPVQGPPGDFRVYFTDGSDATATGSTRTSDDTFTAEFAEGTLNEFVSGAIVDEGTVVGTGGSTDTNRPQELGLELLFEAGDTAGPELLSATIAEEAGDGDTTNRVVRYVFDEEVAAITDGTAFKVYAQDGTSESFAAGTPFPPSDGNCAIDPDNPKVVECVVNSSDTESYAFLGNAVLAAVERDAVETDGGFPNAEGAAVLKAATA